MQHLKQNHFCKIHETQKILIIGYIYPTENVSWVFKTSKFEELITIKSG